MATDADVPGRYDVVIDGEGYRFLDSMQASLSFRTHRAIYGYSPTFVERSNVQGDYGDNQQDFWLTVSDRDWSLGEQQKYYRSSQVANSRYWAGEALDVRVPGQVQINSAWATGTLSENALGACSGVSSAGTDRVFVVGTSKLWEIDNAGTISDRGAHSLTTPQSVTFDGTYVFVSDASAVRSYNVATNTWAAFSSQEASCDLAYLNNTLYGLDSTGLYRYDTAGAATSVYQWKDSAGGVLVISRTVTAGGSMLCPYGGRLYILVKDREARATLYQYDGVGVSSLARFPKEFSNTYGMDVFGDTIAVSGTSIIRAGVTAGTIYAYSAGNIDLLWQTKDPTANAAPAGLAAFRNGFVFQDTMNDRVKYIDLVNGGVSTISDDPGTVGQTFVVTSGIFVATVQANSTTVRTYPQTTIASTGVLVTSLFDFDSSLPKYIKTVMIDADIPAGASIDISYFTSQLLEDLSGTTTSVQTGAVDGTEYNINISARSIGFYITLHKGSSTYGPVLKKIYTRAAPILRTFRRAEYYLDLSGRDGEQMLKLRNNETHPKDGQQMAEDIFTASTATTPFTITDRFGTFTGFMEPDQLELRELKPEEYACHVVVREV